MLDTFNATLSPMLVLFLCILIGYTAQKLKLAPDNTATVLSKLETWFFVPALNLCTFMKYCTLESLSVHYRQTLFSTLVLGIAIAVAIPLSKAFSKTDVQQRNIYKYALAFANFGFMGNAIVPAILGEEMLYVYMMFTLPLNVACYTWGLFVLIPNGKCNENPLKRLMNPPFVSIFIGMILGLTGAAAYVPGFIATAISSCASCMGPIAMILTGFVIGAFSVKNLLKIKKVYIASALRLVVLPVTFIVILYLLGAGKTTVTLAMFAFATPLGLNTVVFPAAYGGDASTGASMAMISHTLCVITIPLLYAAVTALIP